VNGAAEELAAELRGLTALGAPLRVSVDLRDRKPAEKRWEWIRKGAPVVIELGERDIDSGVVTATRRNDPDLGREQIDRDDAAARIAEIVDAMQGEYFSEAADRMAARTATDITDVDAFREYFAGDETDSGGFVRAPWSEDPETEKIMGELGVSVRCVPFDQTLADGAVCVISGAPAKVEAVFAKAY
jgi:prolyl-tRNA synthetase